MVARSTVSWLAIFNSPGYQRLSLPPFRRERPDLPGISASRRSPSRSMRSSRWSSNTPNTMTVPSTGFAAPDDVVDDLRRQRRLFSEVQEVAHIGIWEWEV